MNHTRLRIGKLLTRLSQCCLAEFVDHAHKSLDGVFGGRLIYSLVQCTNGDGAAWVHVMCALIDQNRPFRLASNSAFEQWERRGWGK